MNTEMYIYEHTDLKYVYIYIYHISIYIFQQKMCFNLGKNYILRICWTLGVTRLKRKVTLHCSVITSKESMQ